MLKISGPTLILDKDKSLKNIKEMQSKAVRNNCIFRPHFKTHQSADIGEWYKSLGINQCTVSSLQMAKYFVNAGWKDITVAFPLNIHELDLMNELAEEIKLNVCIESKEVAQILVDAAEHPVGFFIKVDAGYHRTGVAAEAITEITDMLSITKPHKQISFKGFLQHAGHTYHVNKPREVAEIHQQTIDSLLKLKDQFIEEYPDLMLSCGDTPSCSLMEDFSKIDEMRPGNFIFYDVMQQQIGSCSLNQISVAMACPVVAIHPQRNEVIIYGGAVHFSKDSTIDQNGQKIFGLVCKDASDWSDVYPATYIKKLSQEHGTIHAPDEILKNIKIGDILYCLPIHSCLTANLMSNFLTTTGEKIEMFRYNALS